MPLARSFTETGGAWRADVTFETPRDARDVELALPLPAGLEPAGEAEGPAGATMTMIAGTLHFRWERGPGRARFRIPLVRVSDGTFATPPARLRDASGTRWALTAATTTTVTAR
jgi:hypothetical protein